MGFFDKVKKAFGSKKEDVESQNNVNDEVIDEPTFTESMENDDESLNENDEIQSEDSQETPASEEILDEPTPTENIRNFKYLDELIHSGVKKIVLDSDIVLGDGGESEYKEGIRLDVDNLTIDGNGHTIDAQRKTRIFYCTGKNITIKNIILKNGFAERSGGAIYNDKGDLTIIESTLNENTSWDNGGAIYNDGGDLTITGSTLNNNSASDDGGAIYNFIGELTITDSTLTGNRALYDGGAIYNWGELTIGDSIFNKNISRGNDMDIFNRERTFIKENISKTIQIHNDDMGKVYQLKFLKNNQKDFNYLNELINDETYEIKLENDIILNIEKNEQKKFETGIKIDRDNLVIDGNGHTIDAQGFTRIFHCTGKNITVKNIILKNGYAKENGGAICNNGEFSIIDSKLVNNTAKKEDGGAIHNDGKLTVSESAFMENISAGDGGAIYNYDGFECSITGSKFVNNAAKGDNGKGKGGAIYNYDGFECSITGSKFVNNSADFGGAIYNNYVELTITNSTLTGNTAYDGGAISSKFIRIINFGNIGDEAIHNNNGVVTITSSTLTGNTARGSGGAIHNNNGVVTITSSTLTGNTARESGGAIHNWGGELTITGSTLTANTAQGIVKFYRKDRGHKGGGVIYNEMGNSKIFNCEILNNNSPDNIILNNDSLQIHNTSLRDNQSKYIVLNEGKESNLGFFHGKFIENTVEESVLCNDGRFCSVERTVFENNISDNKMNIINNSELTLTNPQIKNKGKSILNQNYILIRRSPPELENIIYGEGTVEVDEKIIPQWESFDFGYLDKKIHESKTKEIILGHDITFETYERDFYEGGIELDIENLIIDGNGHTIDGDDKSRIFIITGKNITLKNIVFKNGRSHKNYDNSLNNNGGAIKINYNNKITIENCEFVNNTSEELGGAMHNDRGELTITGSTLTDNTAGSDGGAIFNSGELTIIDSTLQENMVEGSSGAIFNSGELKITETTLTGNTAKIGGAIFNSGELMITDSTLTGNNAQKEGEFIQVHNSGDELIISEGLGGAITNWEGELKIIDSTLTGNMAKNGGGVVNRGELMITDSTLTGNTTEDDGGAIDNSGSLTITESTLIGNKAVRDGGAIHNSKGELTITESTLTENTAWSGGAIGNSKGVLTITGSTLNDNTSEGMYICGPGGAIFNSGELMITDSALNNNTSGSDGGAIHNFGGGLTIKESTLIGNKAVRDGGAIFHCLHIYFDIKNCKLENNKPDDVNYC